MADAPTKPRPLPRPTLTSKPFWQAAKEGKLMLQWDPGAKQYQFYPRATSVVTGERNLEWHTVSGLGHVHSFTITHVATPGFEDKVPYPVGLIELDEKVRIIANLINVKPDAVTIGMRVKVAFEKLSDEISYFAFEPVG